MRLQFRYILPIRFFDFFAPPHVTIFPLLLFPPLFFFSFPFPFVSRVFHLEVISISRALLSRQNQKHLLFSPFLPSFFPSPAPPDPPTHPLSFLTLSRILTAYNSHFHILLITRTTQTPENHRSKHPVKLSPTFFLSLFRLPFFFIYLNSIKY